MAEKRIRVLVVDDSMLARRSITEALARDPAIEVVGVAQDPYVARERILELDPDVITLDLEMPRMDGLTFLKILQQHHPIPVVVVSSLTQTGSVMALEALAAGAVDVIGKPDGSQNIGELARKLAFLVKAAAHSQHFMEAPKAEPEKPLVTRVSGSSLARKVIVIGASTGGVEALRSILPRLPEGLPPIVIVQHMPAHFSRTMAVRLNQLCRFPVSEAEEGQVLEPNSCLIAPGDYHLALHNGPRGYVAHLTQSPPVHYCRPAVDVLFRSAAQSVGKNTVAALLTGMGADGARGLLTLRAAGARTFAQDEASSIVFGMPKAAIELGAAEKVVSLHEMPQAIVSAVTERQSTRPQSS